MRQRERYDLPSGNDGTDGSAAPVEAIRRQIASGIEILVHLGRGRWKPSGGGDRRITGMEEDEIKIGSCFEENRRGLQKTGELVHREKLEENRMRIREGSQKQAWQRKLETKDRLSDLGIWSGISRNSGNQSWDCRRCKPALLPGVVGMHCCGSGWNRMFHTYRKTGFRDGKRTVRQLPDLRGCTRHCVPAIPWKNAGYWRRQDSWNSRWENSLVQELRRMRHK